ncbi:MAG: RNA polymerase sigma factor [Planctomycetes bacterium]|nr:RNA polymerase sigma factor [Planctomycetota bacterium]
MPGERLSSDESGGEAACFDARVASCHARLYRYLLRLSGRPDEAEELAQQAWVVAWERRGTFAGTGTFLSWLLAIGRNLAMERGRSEARRRRREGAGRVPADGGAVLEEEERVTVRNALDGMEEGVREALWLRVVEGLGFQEVADLQGVAVSTAHARVGQGLRDLAGRIGR